MEEFVIQINGGINNNCGFECKKLHVCKKDYIWDLLHVVVKMGNIQQVLWMILQLGVMKLQTGTWKLSQTTKKKNFNKKIAPFKTKKFIYSACIFINCYSIIDSCQYLLLSDKISCKTKTFITNSRYK